MLGMTAEQQSRYDGWPLEVQLAFLRGLKQQRQQAAVLPVSAGPLRFGQTYTPHLLSTPAGRLTALSPLHEELDAWHRRELTQPPGALDAIAAPRGHGKTTAGVEIPALWHAVHRVRRFIVIASDTWAQAVQRIATITTEVETNERLRAAFPDLRPAVDTYGQRVAWRDDELALANGTRILGVGAGKSIRGAKAGDARPDLLLLDDLEDEASVATPEALEKRLRWITRTALALAGPLRGLSALWVGTILSRSALLNAATGAALDQGQQRPEWARAWTGHTYRAEQGAVQLSTVVVDPDTGRAVEGSDGLPLAYQVGEPMWAELSREDLAAIRYKIGAHSYAAEYLADPVDTATTLFAPPRPAQYVNPTAPPLARLVQLPGGRLVPVAAMTRAAALDPQYADPNANDPDLAAIAVAGAHGAETFLLDSWIGRDRHGQAGQLIDLAVRWGCYAAGVESVSAQATTADQAAADGRVPVVPLRPVAGKVERALPLAVRLGEKGRPETCRVWLLPDADRDTPHGRLSEHLARFPHGRYDDPADATVYAVELAHRATGPASGGQSMPLLGTAR